ncbi:MAG: S8 family serine peptidase [Pirellulaceae bacterium]|nr:S8 family serine peptidase [Pirellulaceae bacterium]
MNHKLKSCFCFLRAFQAFCLLAGCTATMFDLSCCVAGDEGPDGLSFPSYGIMPKKEIGALRFLEKYPQDDGRGVVVAIFDTGVDPGAAGLARTSDGKPKIVDMIDGTGSGDVDTSEVTVAQNNEVVGLTGRTLRLRPEWCQEENSIHLGIKAAYQFFPPELVSRLKRERAEKFGVLQRESELKLQRQIAAWDQLHPTPSEDEEQERGDLLVRLEQLKAAAHAADPGPIFDCIVFREGDVWRAVVDTNEDGDLTTEKAMTNYRAEQQYGTFADGASLNFAVNVYEEGNLLSIVTDTGAHATHVAGIVGGYFPDQPELNGVAPGAQIVSVKIGDTRLDGMETASGMERGVIAAVRNKCDLINMSFGEPSATPNRGAIITLFSQVVAENNVIFVASAGNAGAALSTVGSPGGTTSALIGVGAYVSPQMAAVEYTLRKEIPGMPFSFTSQGPTFDGDLGVDITAPGGAISPFPVWTFNRLRQANGTSMSSPNACGGIALMLSHAKREKISYSPSSVRRALQNTAVDIETATPFSQGAGLIQVDAALEHLRQHRDEVAEQLNFDVSVRSPGNRRGIYLREAGEVQQESSHLINVSPVFPKSASPEEKHAFELRLRLDCDADWVSCGKHLLMNHDGGRPFRIQIDPTSLAPGVHYTEIQGMDTSAAERGPVFRVPITVIIPRAVEDMAAPTVERTNAYGPGIISRDFVTVPAGATWMDLVVRRLGGDTRRLFIVHTVQELDGKTYEHGESKKYQAFQPNQETLFSIPVLGGRTIEICLAQYWSSLGETEVEYSATFRGVVPDSRTISMTTDGLPVPVYLQNSLGTQTVAPAGELTTYRRSQRPTTSRIKLLSESRDQLADGRTFNQLLLTYEFEVEKAGSVTPKFPETDDLLYDAVNGPVLWMLFDSKKQLIASDDIWPSAVRVSKGKHILRLQIRHTDRQVLESMKTLVMHLEQPLAQPIRLAMYPTREAFNRGSPQFAPTVLQHGEKLEVQIAAPEVSALPSFFRPNDLLLGTITYGKKSSTSVGSGERPQGYQVQLVSPTTSSRPVASTPNSKTPKDAAEAAQQLFDFQVRQLQAMVTTSEDELFNQLANEIFESEPDHLPTRVAVLHQLDQESTRKDHLHAVVSAADEVIQRIDQQALANFFGKRIDLKKDAEKKKRFEEHRAQLIDALYRKGRSLGYMELPEVLEKHPIEDPAAHATVFEENFAQLQLWVDTSDEKYFLLEVRRERRSQRFGNALKLLNKHNPNGTTNSWLFKKRRDLYQDLGWQHLFEYEDRWMLLRFPKTYVLH